MAQSNSLFVWKTLSYSSGKTNLRNDMIQVTNLQLLGFRQEIIANLLGVFPEVALCDIDLRGFFDVVFDPHIFNRSFGGRLCCKTSIISEAYLLGGAGGPGQNLFSTSPLLPSPSAQAKNHDQFMSCHLTAHSFCSPWFLLWF